ncbi:Intersectin-EH binding protein Ibp1 OS=Tsukamurella paurometabola (strain ATCC 8368 / DSM /CCUG 35730 / CIP 100753 / JCM 10117 / KCTC 9821 / NBRC 16120/ NCIMB 702349 / NCTC 13040) OX=521096 GN=Tpau_1089 PE=4 SV=1 [Tsukamurella paurometabola]|uniref:Uncharacterized protein n=1 Tax=Tsukamurella paurometabola (strain ATCC 8368 / DSM 20162 / CCUG 35730 / CIP 100753 / JCM 10117 / KCTC 9821 / NBRC 16120 / NCIMB 702349 / NCTC 13040) TaxID=521096 RepID=D5UVD1_TSUPD|nr:hypothetical protein [Tsukamurella paurometabola]ADG77721.1 hypothetical protein Tpau_1089 [Tsukamurella paurometabola DSM 20162]SUP28491.1 Uncharacterised protein [Tsukamurella paurometabola]
MRTTTTSPRTRILTAVAGSAVAAGAVIGGFALTGTANAEPGSGTAAAAPAADNLPKCTAFINPDGTIKADRDAACLPVDPFTEPGLTLEQRKALINTDAGTRASGSAQEDFAKLDQMFGGK